MNIVIGYILSYTEKLDKEKFFSHLHPNFECQVIRKGKIIIKDQKDFMEYLKNSHFSNIEKAEIRKLNITKVGDNHYLAHVISLQHRENGSLVHVVEDNQEFKISESTDKILFVKHEYYPIILSQKMVV